MFRVIGITLVALTLSVHFLPASDFGQGQAKVQKGVASAGKETNALGGAYKKADVKALVEILGPQGHRLMSSGDAVEDRIEHDWFVPLYDEGHEIQGEQVREQHHEIPVFLPSPPDVDASRQRVRSRASVIREN